MRRFLRDESGQAMTEYVLVVLGLIVVFLAPVGSGGETIPEAVENGLLQFYREITGVLCLPLP